MALDDDIALVREALRRPASPSSDYDLNLGIDLPLHRKLRPAAVLVALLPVDGAWHVLLTKRSSKLRHHPGQIAFPGGKFDPEDPTPEACATREAHEEIGLLPSSVQVLGQLMPHETVTNYHVTPVVARVEAPFEPVSQEAEVAEVFTVPLSMLTDPSQFRVEGRRWQGRRRYYFAVPYGPYYIWGATARMLKGLADRVQACR
ncbi:MAG: CoA pyrophosphatase [Pseudomonadota bacterium]